MKVNQVLLSFFIMFYAMACMSPGHAFAPSESISTAESEPSREQTHELSLKPVARVNDSMIFLSDLMQEMQNITMKNYGRREITPDLANRIKNEAMAKLITEEVVKQHVDSKNIEVSDEAVQEKLQQFKKDMGDEKHFQYYLRKMNKTETLMLDEMKRALALEQILAEEIDNKIKIDDQELDRIYEENKDKFIQQEKIEITDIIFFLDAEDKASYNQAELLQKKALKEYSDKLMELPSDGSFAVQEKININRSLHPALYKTAKTLQPGEMSDVINADGTLHIIKLTGYNPEKKESKEKSIADMRRDITKQMRQKMLNEWLTDLKDKADIEVMDMMADE